MTLTDQLIISTILVLALTDIYLYFRSGNAATFSRTILDLSMSGPWGLLIPLAFGVLIGHFFVPQHIVSCP